MLDAPRPTGPTGGSNVSRAWAPQGGDRRVFPPPPRRPPHGAAAADNDRRGEEGGAGEEAGVGWYARRGGGVADREVAVGGASADPAGAGRYAATVAEAGGEAPAPPAARKESRGGGRGGGGVGSKRPAAPPAQHLSSPPKRRAVFPPPASRRTAAAPAPLAGADANTGSRTRYNGERENRGSGTLVEKPAVARPLAARKDAVARPLASRKDGVGVLSRAVAPNAAGTRALKKPDAIGGAAPMASTGRHGPRAGMVKSSAAEGRGRGAGTHELWGKNVPVTDISASRTSQPGRGKDGGFSSKLYRPLESGRAHGGLVVPEEMLDDDISLADGRAVQIGVAVRTGTSVRAVTKDGKKGEAPSKESRGYQVSSNAAMLDSARDSSGVSGNFGRKTPSRALAKNVKVTNKYGGSSYRSNTAAASFAKDRVMQAPMAPDMSPMIHKKKAATNRDFLGHMKMVKPKVVDHQQRIASTSVSGSKGKLDDYILKFDDIFRDIKVQERKLELYLYSSSGLPCVRCQRQYGYRNADPRSRFKTSCRMFEFVCRTLVQIMEQRSLKMRVDFEAAEVMKTKLPGLIIHGPIVGPVPGVEVGDEFLYRSQLAIAGLHHYYRTGIATTTYNGMLTAISIVASGGYPDELGCSGELIYTGSGGKPAGKKKDEDQRLKGGNLALKNCIKAKTPVRVIHGFKSRNTERAGAKLVSRYTYDGLYRVVDFWIEGQPGSRVFKYKLEKIPGQPQLPMHIANTLTSYKSRPGLCMNDISKGKEATPIRVINEVDDVQPAPFRYTTRIRYPFMLSEKHQGCGCTDGCSDSVSCACAVKNGGEIPFDLNGRTLNDKSVIFECGPSCKCPPSCHNRVSQHDMKIRLELFRTPETGWGVRSLRSIPSGSFICEYIGELLHRKEAGKRRNRSYLFDVGLNSDDENDSGGLLSNVSGLNSSSSCPQTKEDVHFTIDASEYGNIGRFINHSCSPNLQAQNVLRDHADRRMPHIMFFAAETIPPLQELTYDYNNSEIDRVRGLNGRVKAKVCRCGSSQCRGRFY